MNDPAKLRPLVDQAMTETLEGMAFIAVSPDSQPFPPEAELAREKWVWAQVEVKTPLNGKFIMAFSSAVAKKIVQALFLDQGQDALGDEQKMADVMKEMVNVMAGRCLNQMVSEEFSFALGLPEFGSGWPRMDQASLYRFVTDDGNPLVACVAVG